MAHTATVSSSFDDALARARGKQAETEHAALAAQREHARLLSLASALYAEIQSAGQEAFRVLSAAGAERARVPHLEVAGERAIHLQEVRHYRMNTQKPGLWVLDSGVLITVHGLHTKQDWWNGRYKPATKWGQPVLDIESYPTVSITRSNGVFPQVLCTYSVAPLALSIRPRVRFERDINNDVIDVVVDGDHESTTRSSHRSAVDYIANLTTSKLDRLRRR